MSKLEIIYSVYSKTDVEVMTDASLTTGKKYEYVTKLDHCYSFIDEVTAMTTLVEMCEANPDDTFVVIKEYQLAKAK